MKIKKSKKITNKIELNGDKILIELGYYLDELNNNELKILKDEYFYSKNSLIKKSEDIATYRMISYWTEIGIINDDRVNKKGWRKFNFIDTIWLSIVIKLRNFKTSKEIVLKAKEQFYNDKLLKELYILKSLKGEDINVIITSSGEFKFLDKIDMLSVVESNIDEYYIISITKIISNIIGHNILDEKLITTLLGEKEYGLRKEIMQGNDGEKIEISLKNGRLHKYKKEKYKNIKRIYDIKKISLKEISTDYPNSRIIIYTNNTGIKEIVVQK